MHVLAPADFPPDGYPNSRLPGARVSGTFRERSPLLYPVLAGKRILGTPGREEPSVSGRSAPLLPGPNRCSQGEPILGIISGRGPGFRDDRAPFFRLFFNRNPFPNGHPSNRITRGGSGFRHPEAVFRRPRTAPERPRPGERTEGRPGGHDRAIGRGSIARSRRTWRRPRGIRPGLAR